MKKFLVLVAFSLLLIGCGEVQTTGSSADATVTALTNGKTGEVGYFVALAQISPVYGKVTNATITPPQSGTKIGVAFDVTMNNPTQSRIKHVSHDILMIISLEQDVSHITINFHADGYTGMDDPIATSNGVADKNKWVVFDDNGAWDESNGVFNADLPA